MIRKLLKLYLGYRKKSLERKQEDEWKNNNKELFEYLKRNIEFKGCANNERCFIIGNGPSLLKQDLSFLKNEKVMMVNLGRKIETLNSVKALAHFWADPDFFNEKLDIDYIKEFRVAEIMSEFVFYESVGFEYIKRNQLISNKTRFFRAYSFLGNDCIFDFDNWVSGASTVVQYAIELAIYMGFKEIYLIGCDTTTIIPYLDSILERNSRCLSHAYYCEEMEQKGMKHLIENYSVENQLYGTARMFTGYRILADYCAEHEIELYNATEGGLLDVVKRVNYLDLFRRDDDGTI